MQLRDIFSSAIISFFCSTVKPIPLSRKKIEFWEQNIIKFGYILAN